MICCDRGNNFISENQLIVSSDIFKAEIKHPGITAVTDDGLHKKNANCQKTFFEGQSYYRDDRTISISLYEKLGGL